jgi:diguanylate cyclase (GGDEF)-like protein
MAEETTGVGNVGELEAEIARLKEENSRLKASNRRWMRIAGTEDLTGLPNKVYFTTALFPQLVSSANAEGHSLACIMLAPDGLGEINQKFGRKGGDQLIKAVAEFMKQNLDKGERLVHSDGSNFIVVMPKNDRDRAKRRSLTLRAKIVSQRFEVESNPMSLTLSMGIVSRVASGEGEEISVKDVTDSFLRKLAVALDEAKQQGGDRSIEDADSHF